MTRTELAALPAFQQLVTAERARKVMARRAGGLSALKANSDLCFRLEQQVMAQSGWSFPAVNGAAITIAYA